MGFDPDKYLAEKVVSGSQSFDPDKYLSEKAGADPWNTEMPKDDAMRKALVAARGNDLKSSVLKSYDMPENGYFPPEGAVSHTLAALPATGAALGGMAAGYPGAAGGGMIGKELQGLGEHYVHGKPLDDVGTSVQKDIESVPNSLAQQLLGNAAGAIGEKLQGMGAPPKENAAQIQAAADKLKVKPTQGMMTSDPTIQTQEDSLSQSPSLPGRWIQNERKPVFDAIQGAAEEATKDANSESPFDAGRQNKKNIVDYIKGRAEPIGQKYDEIETHTQNIPVDANSAKRISNNIGNIDEAKFSGSPGQKVAGQFQGWLNEANTVEDVRNLKTKAQRIASDMTADSESRQAASQIADKLDRFLVNSTKRGAINLARGVQPAYDAKGRFMSAEAQDGAAQTEGQALGRGLLQDLGKTNKEYAQLMGDLKQIGEGSGLYKPKAGKGPGTITREIEATPNEEINPALFNKDNYEYLAGLREKAPHIFEIARQQKLNEIVAKSTNPANGELSSAKMDQTIKNLGPEVQNLLFGEEGVQGLADARTLRQAIPRKTGQSGTPEGHALHDILSPWQNINDFGRYGLLKSKAKLPALGAGIKRLSIPYSGLLRRESDSE